jgi:N-glycosylase/DNA lyase
MPSIFEVPLVGPAGEPVDFVRTINGHGVTSLAPMSVDETASSLRLTLRLPSGAVRSVLVTASGASVARCEVLSDVSTSELAGLVRAVRWALRLEADLSPFYRIAGADPALSWVVAGAGRMTRCQTVFEDVVKTICTTNCAWSATIRMTNALVEHLGEVDPHAAVDGVPLRAFPTPAAMAAADEEFYRAVVKAGYRGAYIKKLAQSIVDGELELESLATASAEELPDAEMAARLLALPGVGPYAAAHIMMMLGRYSRLILDSWTRPAFARIAGAESVPDAEIIERFAPYGDYAGLAFWLFVTKQWIADDVSDTE